MSAYPLTTNRLPPSGTLVPIAASPMGSLPFEERQVDHAYSSGPAWVRTANSRDLPIDTSGDLYHCTARSPGFRNSAVNRPYFEARQEWEGYVSNIWDDAFSAVLVDITHGDGRPSDEAVFSLEDVPESDRSLLREGAVFRWTLGYRVDRGTRFRASFVTFRRMPAWSKREIEAAKSAGKQLGKKLRPE